MIASRLPVREAAERPRWWCADLHLRKLAELERLELLRAHAEEEQAAQAAVDARRRTVERDQVRGVERAARLAGRSARRTVDRARLATPRRAVTVIGTDHAEDDGDDGRSPRRADHRAGDLRDRQRVSELGALTGRGDNVSRRPGSPVSRQRLVVRGLVRD